MRRLVRKFGAFAANVAALAASASLLVAGYQFASRWEVVSRWQTELARMLSNQADAIEKGVKDNIDLNEAGLAQSRTNGELLIRILCHLEPAEPECMTPVRPLVDRSQPDVEAEVLEARR